VDFAQRVYAAAAKVSGMLVAATVTPAGGNPVTVQVGFTEATEMVLGDVIASVPAIQFATADIPSLAVRDLVTVGGRNWTVRALDRLHDGGETRAALSKA